MPERRYNKGTRPGITGKEPMGFASDDEIRWKFPETEITEKEKVNLIAAALEIGVKTSFQRHLYQFNGKVYRQTSGGPIGLRITMAAARIVMGEWGERYTKIMLQAELKIWLKGLYVDDVRTGTTVLAKGKRWDDQEKKFIYRDAWKEEDEKNEDSDTKRMSLQLNKAMNSVFEGINLTIEIAEDFKEKKLPTLEFKLWVETSKEGLSQVRYSFFEKEMNTPYCILERSAMAEQSKVSSLTQDLIRRLTNTYEGASQCEKNLIVEKFIQKLKISGYKKIQVREIIESGLKGYITKVERAKKDGRDLHMAALPEPQQGTAAG